MNRLNRWSGRDLFLLTTASFFVSMISPSGAMGQTAVRVEMPQASSLKDGQILRLSGKKEPGTVAGGYLDANSKSLLPVRLKSDAILRETPEIRGRNLGSVGSKILDNDVLLSGEAKPGWVEVLYGGQAAWLPKAAVEGLPDYLEKMAAGEPTKSAEVIPSAPKPVLAAPTTKPSLANEKINFDQIPAVKKTAVVDKTAEKPKAAPKPARCASNYQEFQRNPALVQAMENSNPYTQWTGPAGATINVSTSGMATINHPLKGQFNVSTQLCMDAHQQPYLTVMGQTIYFQGPGKGSVSIGDPESGQQYQFNKSMQ